MAVIKKHFDNCSDIDQQLKSDKLIATEAQELRSRKWDELQLASSWIVRHKMLVARNSEGVSYKRFSGDEHVDSYMEYVEDNESVASRILSTSGAVSLQSDRLKKISERLARKLIINAGYSDFEMPDINQVEIAATTITRLAEANEIELADVDRIAKGIEKTSLKASTQLFEVLNNG